MINKNFIEGFEKTALKASTVKKVLESAIKNKKGLSSSIPYGKKNLKYLDLPKPGREYLKDKITKAKKLRAKV